jgi:hypothetical protein
MKDLNDANRQIWIKNILERVPKGSRLLDAGAGELRNRRNCHHLDYVSQDFCQYKGNVNGGGVTKSNLGYFGNRYCE